MAAVLATVAAPAALAQQPSSREPHIGYVYPAGGQQGTTFEVTVGGQFLAGVSGARVSGGAVEATVIEHVRPLTAAQALLLRDQLKELQEKRRFAQSTTRSATATPWTDADAKTVAEIQKKLSTFVRRPSSPAIAETVKVKVTIAKDAEPGDRQLRLRTPAGLTNPLVFRIGQFQEFSEKPTTNAGEPTRSAARDEMHIPSLPATLNGQILPGGIDRFTFEARRGQHVIIAVSARELVPYLPDAVPGWFQATLALFGPDGKEIAYADDFRFSPDPVLRAVIPVDGRYALEIRDAIYRGREDFIYRATIGPLPYVTSAFPPGGQAGTHAGVELAGYNLRSTRLVQDLRSAAPCVEILTAHRGTWLSNPVPFAVDTLPECLQHEPNDRPEQAQPVALPLIVNGRIDSAGDRDVYRIEGRAGQEVVAEVLARRLHSPLDSIVRLTDSAGKPLAFNDDHDDKGQGLLTHHADSYLRAKLPADGSYYLELTDAQGNGGAEYVYRLRISAPRPDFELRIVPSAINVRRGGSATATVYVLRKDGFDGDVALSMTGATKHLIFKQHRAAAGQDQVRVTISAAGPPARMTESGPVDVSIVGRASMPQGSVERCAQPADDMMQAFLYRHLVPADELLVTVVGRPVAPAAAATKPSSRKSR